MNRPSTVGDLMALDPIVVGADVSLSAAAELMDHHRISGLPVVDGSGSLIGVISQTDLLHARSTEYLWANWPGLAVRHLMTSPAVTITRSAPLSEAATTMERRHIHRLVVVADGDARRPIGVISTSDLVHAMAIQPHGVSAALVGPTETAVTTPIETSKVTPDAR